MPFVKVNIQEEINKLREEDPEFRKAWDDSREEYRLIGEMIKLRKNVGTVNDTRKTRRER